MASASDLVVSGIKAGDNLRIDNYTFTASQTGADITVLTRSGKGYVDSLRFINNEATAGLTINSIKVTIDGATERILSTNTCFNNLRRPDSQTSGYREMPIPIVYKTSITVKVNYDTGATFTSAKGLITHSIG